MFVFEKYRQKGMGRFLCQKLAQMAKDGGQKIHLFVHSDNKKAKEFYLKVGFQLTGDCFYAKYDV